MSIPDPVGIASGDTTIYTLLISRAELPELDAAAPPRFLSTTEREQFALLTVPKRRADWLLGRWTAKQLVYSVIAGGQGDDSSLRQIVIARRTDGSPYVTDEHGAILPVSLSISHSHGYAFCALVRGSERPLGADIEFIETRSPQFAADYFTASELDTLPDTLSDTERDLLVTAIWSGKEAALKAVRAGLTVDTRTVSCLFDDAALPAGTWSTFRIDWGPDQRAAHRPALDGLWVRSGPFVLTLALSAPDNPPASQA